MSDVEPVDIPVSLISILANSIEDRNTFTVAVIKTW
jgi:hypothetical protein